MSCHSVIRYLTYLKEDDGHHSSNTPFRIYTTTEIVHRMPSKKTKGKFYLLRAPYPDAKHSSKEQCNPSPIPGTQCSNCAKRWPPVQCVFQQPTGNKKGHASLQSVFVFQSSKDGAKRSGGSRGRTRTAPSVSAPAAPPPLPSPRSAVGGVLTEIHCMESHPIEKTARNAELMDFCKITPYPFSFSSAVSSQQKHELYLENEFK